MDDRVQVAVRVRPSMREERIVATAIDSTALALYNPFDEDDVLRQNRQREKAFAFDRVFDATATQEHVFNETSKLLIGDFLGGTNVTVFAYGATGSGKTHTMNGTDRAPGIIPQTLRALFGQFDSEKFIISMSYIEIYNEQVRDLLSASKQGAEYLDVRDDGIKGTVIAGMKTVEAKSADVLLLQAERAGRFRITEATAANSVSSRSHAVLQLTLIAIDGKRRRLVSKLSLIDLAGSERAAATQNAGVRMLEGSMINRSLLALGNCINALSSKVSPAYVNFRDSKLTRILKDSLGGGSAPCRTIMIANISPTMSSFDETWNTIKYATRAKSIKVKPLDPRFAHGPGVPGWAIQGNGGENDGDGGVGDKRASACTSPGGSTLSDLRASRSRAGGHRRGAPTTAATSSSGGSGERLLKSAGTRSLSKHSIRRGATNASAELVTNDMDGEDGRHPTRPPKTPRAPGSNTRPSTSVNLPPKPMTAAARQAVRLKVARKALPALLQSHLELKRRAQDTEAALYDRVLLLGQQQLRVERAESEASLRAAYSIDPTADDQRALAAARQSLLELEGDADGARRRWLAAQADLDAAVRRIASTEADLAGKLAPADAVTLRSALDAHGERALVSTLEFQAVAATRALAHRDAVAAAVWDQHLAARALIDTVWPMLTDQQRTPGVLRMYTRAMSVAAEKYLAGAPTIQQMRDQMADSNADCAVAGSSLPDIAPPARSGTSLIPNGKVTRRPASASLPPLSVAGGGVTVARANAMVPVPSRLEPRSGNVNIQ
ncbi:P-loop containing nucleoside triphosphate hydrolase protein [Blastocladiella britannica]|nr:P-loop containing nucleoside triphosphate hydrolase protein [Blastocladiella britannica]